MIEKRKVFRKMSKMDSRFIVIVWWNMCWGKKYERKKEFMETEIEFNQKFKFPS